MLVFNPACIYCSLLSVFVRGPEIYILDACCVLIDLPLASYVFNRLKTLGGAYMRSD